MKHCAILEKRSYRLLEDRDVKGEGRCWPFPTEIAETGWLAALQLSDNPS